jgi:hypothetical protein
MSAYKKVFLVRCGHRHRRCDLGVRAVSIRVEGKVTDGEPEPECGIARAGTFRVKKASSRDIAEFLMNINAEKQNAVPLSHPSPKRAPLLASTRVASLGLDIGDDPLR